MDVLNNAKLRALLIGRYLMEDPNLNEGNVLELMILYNGVIAPGDRLKENDLRSRRRFQHILPFRQVADYIYVTRFRRSTPYVGNLIGGRDHSTVINSVKRITNGYEAHKDVLDLEYAGNLEKMITDVSKFRNGRELFEDNYQFVVLKDGTNEALFTIGLVKNTLANIWKIDRLFP